MFLYFQSQNLEKLLPGISVGSLTDNNNNDNNNDNNNNNNNNNNNKPRNGTILPCQGALILGAGGGAALIPKLIGKAMIKKIAMLNEFAISN